MARDRQLPGFLRKVHPVHRVPVNATFLIAAISVALGIYMAERSDGIALLSTMVNFGALTAFILLHLSVVNHFVVRQGSRSPVHWLVPLCGIVILGYVLWSANLAAQATGLTWLGIGIVVAVALYLAGRRLEMPDVPEEMESREP
jgi:amino acid transporter